jgi:hypothetical protein
MAAVGVEPSGDRDLVPEDRRCDLGSGRRK